MSVEEPKYLIALKEGNFEIRDYPGQIAAEVSVSGERFSAANAGFRILAKYIFGGNERRTSIAMTAPVTQNPIGAESIAMTKPVKQIACDNGWVIRFGIPRGATLDSLPTPKDKRIRLLSLPPTRFAVARFSGLAREPSISMQTAQLMTFIAAHHFEATGQPSLARYNPPWTLWFLRRNEIMIPLKNSDPL